MNRIEPINQDTCGRFIGMPVCAILHDGSRHYGIISKVEGGKLILNDDPQSSVSSGISKQKKGKAVTSGKSKPSGNSGLNAQTSAFPGPYAGYGPFLHPFPFGGRLALDLAAIAFLFLLFI